MMLTCPTVASEHDVEDGWTVTHIGECTGVAQQDGETFTIETGGKSVGGLADSFTFVHRELTETNAEIIAKVTGDPTLSTPRVGVMFRASTEVGAANGFVFGTLGEGSQFSFRQADAETTPFALNYPYLNTPAWVKAVRRGNQVTGYVSADGEHWLQLGTKEIALGTGAVQVGIAASASSSTPATLTLESIEVLTGDASTTEPDVLPDDPALTLDVMPYTDALEEPWLLGKIGSGAVAQTVGAQGGEEGQFSISNRGSDLWDEADGGGFVYQAVTGDVDIVARIEEFEATNPWAKVGVMIRADVSGAAGAGAANTSLVFTAANGLCQQQRLVAEAMTTNKCFGLMRGGGWLKLERRGQVIQGYISRTGEEGSWFQASALGDTFAAADLPAAAYVGIVATSHDEMKTQDARFSGVTITPR